MSTRFEINPQHLIDFSNKFRIATFQSAFLREIRFYTDREYEKITKPGAVLELGRQCKGAHLTTSWVEQTLQDWEADLTVLVAYYAKESVGVGYITMAIGKGNASPKDRKVDYSATYRDWITIDIVCVKEDYRNVGLGNNLLAAALYLAKKSGMTHAAIQLSGGINRNEFAAQSYQRFGFKSDDSLVGYFKQDGGRRNVKNDPNSNTLMSVNILNIDPKLLYEGVEPVNLPERVSIHTPPQRSEPPSLSTYPPTREMDELKLKADALEAAVEAWRNKYRTLQGELEKAMDELQAVKREKGGSTATIETMQEAVELAREDLLNVKNRNGQLEAENKRLLSAIEQLEKPRTPSNEALVLSNALSQKEAVIKARDKEIARLNAELSEAKRSFKVFSPPKPIPKDPEVIFLEEEEKKITKRRQMEEEARKKKESQKERDDERKRLAEEEKKRIEEMQKRAAENLEKVRKERIEIEESVSEEEATQEEDVPEPPKKKKVVVTSKFFTTDMSEAQTKSIVSNVIQRIEDMKQMDKDTAIAHCKKKGCPICGDRDGVHQILQQALELGTTKTKKKQGASEAEKFRVRYNVNDLVALCNACYATLYGGTVSTNQKKWSFPDYAIQPQVVKRRNTVNSIEKKAEEESVSFD